VGNANFETPHPAKAESLNWIRAAWYRDRLRPAHFRLRSHGCPHRATHAQGHELVPWSYWVQHHEVSREYPIFDVRTRESRGNEDADFDPRDPESEIIVPSFRFPLGGAGHFAGFSIKFPVIHLNTATSSQAKAGTTRNGAAGSPAHCRNTTAACYVAGSR